MSVGHTVVLLHDELYDSLYDVLNQRYLDVNGKRFSNISIRNETIRVQIHPSFRFIIVVPVASAHHTSDEPSQHTPIAFLNRLEKQYVTIENLRASHARNWEKLLLQFKARILKTLQNNTKKTFDYFSAFAGYVPTLTFASVLMYAQNVIAKANKQNDNEDHNINALTDTDQNVFDYGIALLLANCYLPHFITHRDLSLKDKLKVIDRVSPFSSLRDVIKYFTAKTMNCLESNEPILLRVTTHDHFHQRADVQKYFKVKNRFLEYEFETLLNAFDIDEDSKQHDLEELVLVNINEIVSA
eukprot:966908_1